MESLGTQIVNAIDELIDYKISHQGTENRIELNILKNEIINLIILLFKK